MFYPPPPVGTRSRPTGLVLALIAAFVLFSACRSGSNSDEIIEVIDSPNGPTTPTVVITISGDYEGAITLNYAEKSTSTSTKPISGTIADNGIVQLASYPPKGSIIVSIQAGAGTNPPVHYIGRSIGTSAVSLKLKLNSSGGLELRPADSESKIPIGTYSEFQLIRTNTETLGGSYKQEADLDLMGNAGLDVPEWQPIGIAYNTDPFTGNYDGDGKNIKRLYIDKSSIDNVGLFGYATGHLANIHIASGSVTGKDKVGGIAGCGNNISGCSNSADVTGTSYVGGIVGSGGTISTCYNSGKIESSGGYTGGVAGSAYSAGVSACSACYNTGDVISSGDKIGGVVGYAYSGVSACYNAGSVKGKDIVGGVVGLFDTMGAISMTACYNTGSVEGKTRTGGLLGDGPSSTLTACYNIGSVSSAATSPEKIGSVVGSGYRITACYWQTGTADTSGYFTTGAATQFDEVDFFAPSISDSAEWGTGDGTASGKYWKAGTTNGNMLPQLSWER